MKHHFEDAPVEVLVRADGMLEMGEHSAMMGTGHDVRVLAQDEGALLRRQSTGSPR